MKRMYHIRFNTQHQNSGWVWRVLDGPVEHLARNLDIRVPVKDSILTSASGETKWNICCEGYLFINELGVATITNEKIV